MTKIRLDFLALQKKLWVVNLIERNHFATVSSSAGAPHSSIDIFARCAHRAIGPDGIDYAAVKAARGNDSVGGTRERVPFLLRVVVTIVRDTIVDIRHSRVGWKGRGKTTVMRMTVGPFGVACPIA